MGKVFKREGFVSSPLEERARLVHAMSQEIANTINNIDGVVTARVHLVVP
jgi:type III secretion protein J